MILFDLRHIYRV